MPAKRLGMYYVHAYIPAPVYFGQLLDLACQYRVLPVASQLPRMREDAINATSNTGGSSLKIGPAEGSCVEYNLSALPMAWLGGVIVLKLISCVLLMLTFLAARFV
ncbi:unnamed protein product [Protopolystoma xenopodis]|uniref:Uncharacterized protein n=1 Tax=Protopolystoma xenopodis TaxID=117903 RepID=A0A3S4ZMJ6_9PLAT|nr:unnamed protein product [Protopolystoma xenopodis]